MFPKLLFEFNNKSIINSELDIYLSELKLAFELNGIFHYQPIYGQEKLLQIQRNDSIKSAKCIEHDIELFQVNTSHQKIFDIKTSKVYLDIISNIIEQKLIE